MYQIEKGIEVPAKKIFVRKSIYPFATMEVGDSFSCRGLTASRKTADLYGRPPGRLPKNSASGSPFAASMEGSAVGGLNRDQLLGKFSARISQGTELEGVEAGTRCSGWPEESISLLTGGRRAT